MISWLPAAHIAERIAHHYLPIVFGMTVTTCPNLREIVAYLPAVKPTWFFAVPRIFEKLKAGPRGRISPRRASRPSAGSPRRGARSSSSRPASRCPRTSRRTAAEGDAKLFGGLRAMLGLDEAISVNAGAAPTPRDVLVFFHAIGIPLGELWGMSETCGVGAVNPPGARSGSAPSGPPSPGRRDAAGRRRRAAVRGDVVMAGYRNQPEKTAEAIDADGWLHTGDIARIDEDGYVAIVDRKKEIIINAAGKNMSPANIESTLKGAGPVIGQIVRDRRRAALQHGAGRARLRLRARVRRAAWGSRASRSRSSPTRRQCAPPCRPAVDKGNAELARVEQIKKFTIVRGRLAARRRRADADDEAQAQADRREVRARDRGDVRP